MVAGVLGAGHAVEAAGGGAEERGVVDGARHVELAGEADRLAGLAALEPGELLGALVEQLGGLEQHRRALDRGGPAPLLEGGGCRGDRGVDVVVTREGDRLDGLVGARVEHVEGLARGGVAPLPADVLVHGREHTGRVAGSGK